MAGKPGMLTSAAIAILGLAVVTEGYFLYENRQNQEALQTALSQKVAQVRDEVTETQQEMDKALDKVRSSDEFAKDVRNEIEAFIADRRTRNSPKLKDSDHVIGNPDAKVSLIVYSDMECPYCKQLHQKRSLRKLVRSSEGQINAAFRHFPLKSHGQIARRKAEVAECVGRVAGDASFWTFVDSMFGQGGKGGANQSLTQVAVSNTEAGKDELRSCLNGGDARQAVINELKQGAKYGVQSTPTTMVVNNETGKVRKVAGAVGPEQLAKAVQAVTGS